MIAIFYALKEEIEGIHYRLSNIVTIPHPWATIEKGQHGSKEIYLIQSGAGKVLSSITVQQIIDLYSPESVMLCGVSGALNPDYHRGDLVIGYDFIQHDILTEYFGFAPGQVPFTDYKIIPSTERLREHALKLTLSDAQVHCGRILSGDQFISGSRGAELRAQFDGDVVDMESAAVAFTCHLNKIPFVVARTISDRADQNAANDFGEFLETASRHVEKFILHMLSL